MGITTSTFCRVALGDMLTSLLFEYSVTIESHTVLVSLRMDTTGEYHVEYTDRGDDGGVVSAMSACAEGLGFYTKPSQLIQQHPHQPETAGSWLGSIALSNCISQIACA